MLISVCQGNDDCTQVWHSPCSSGSVTREHGDDEGEGELVTCSNNVTFTHTLSSFFPIENKENRKPNGEEN